MFPCQRVQVNNLQLVVWIGGTWPPPKKRKEKADPKMTVPSVGCQGSLSLLPELSDSPLKAWVEFGSEWPVSLFVHGVTLFLWRFHRENKKNLFGGPPKNIHARTNVDPSIPYFVPSMVCQWFTCQIPIAACLCEGVSHHLLLEERGTPLLFHLAHII